ncbi:helix-turn-helix domain-containing protein [uncultured Duncaniella sp.]|jgi:y4mF family transcriptional regulator|uniref:helix-turn-helix domain-containing protein n=2 Tax=Muribaculum intestinale TaxID=1796646 RepID=UPI000F4A5E77|nr:helix-turn-helix domain-containing protein [uncultured Duncaniella sp.]ROT03969.1 transcriptional regulator [Muribaculaceae bacterium Isolate-100 (HZI)]RXE64139.1 transcriptional regulator [Muribaculaceae bacterium Isolate-007 (NCI)]
MELMDIMKQRRETLSLTQQDLAEMSQVGLATIKDIERGKGNPALSTVKKILDVLGIEIEYSIRQTV